jgi:hypothetical protein
MQKRGQLTVFIVIAMVIGLSYYMMVRLGEETSKAKMDTSVKTAANFGADAEAFDTYLRSAFEAAIYSSLVAWGSSGGADILTTSWQTQTYTYAEGSRTIALLLDEFGPQPSIKEEALEDLKTLVQSNFNSVLDRSTFQQRGYTLLIDNLPVVEINTNEEGTTTFTLTLNIRLMREDRVFDLKKQVFTLDVGIRDMLEEITPLLTAIDTTASPYQLSSHTFQTNAPLRICAYPDALSTTDPCAGRQCNLIRIMYDAPLKRYSSYRFDFLVKDAVTGCTS